MRSRALITGIAMFLATGTAHAQEKRIFECEKIVDRYSPQADVGNAVTVTHEHISDSELYKIDITAFHHRKKAPLVVTFDVEKEKLKVNGKPCKPIKPAEDK